MEDFNIKRYLLDCSAKISGRLMNSSISKFKIGKTAGDVQHRYNCDENYKKEFDEIISIYETDNKELIDELEQQLIKNFKLTYPYKCVNSQEGGGPNCADSTEKTASIYIVVKYA